MKNSTSESQKRAMKKYMNNHERINVVLEKGTKGRITNIHEGTIADFIRKAVEEKLLTEERVINS